jgi:hypothetical protein
MSFHPLPEGRSDTIMGLVELPFGRISNAELLTFKPQSSTDYEGENAHGSEGWNQRLRPHWPQRFARRSWK